MSLKEVAGGPSPAAIAETRTAAKAASGVSGKYAVVDGADQASNEFPYVPFAPDSYDDTAMIKQAFAQMPPAAPGGANNWVVPFDAKDAEYVKRQRDQVENADFDRWVMQKFDLTDPAQLFLFQSIAPEQFQRRLDLIDYEQNLVTRYAKTRLMGARNIEDLKLEWLIETKRVELPKGPIWDPVKWMGAQMGLAPEVPANNADWAARGVPNNTRFMAGLFSPLKYLTQQNAGEEANAFNRADIRGNGEVLGGQLFHGSGQPQSAVIQRYGQNPVVNDAFEPYAAGVDGQRFGYTAARRPGVAGGIPAGYGVPGRLGYGRVPVLP